MKRSLWRLKGLGIFLVCVLFLGALALACWAKEVRIVHYHWTQPPYDEIVKSSAESFMKENPNVKVEVLFFPDPDLPTKVRLALMGEGDIDTFALPNMLSAWYMANGLCAEIDPGAFGKQTIEEVVDMWLPDAFRKTGGFYEGKYYGIPHEMSNYVAWINIAHMKEAGLDPANLPSTWSEFVETCKKLVVKEGNIYKRNGFAINLKAPIFPFLVLHSFMEQKGLGWSTEAGFVKSLGTKEALEAFTTFTNFATKDGIFDPGLFDDDREGFGNGLTSTFLTGGTWYWGVLEKYSVKPEDVTPFKYPRFSGGKDVGGPVYGYSIFVARHSKNQEWAWKWIDHLESNPEAYIVHGYFQPRKSLDPALADKYIPNNDVFGYERDHGAILLASPKFNEVTDAVGEAIHRVVFSGENPEEVLKSLQEEVKNILE